MKRADLLASIAALLPLGAIAVVPEPAVADAPKAELPKPSGTKATRWMIVHASDGDRLPYHHVFGEDCAECSKTGVPVPVWYGH